MRIELKYIVLLIFVQMLWSASCTFQDQNSISIQGKLLNGDRNDVFFQFQPIHYKFADKDIFKIEANSTGEFDVRIPKNADVVWFHVGDAKTPIFLNKSSKITIKQTTASDYIFDVDGYSEINHDIYNAYLTEDLELQKELRQLRKSFLDGNYRSYLSVAKTRITLAKNHLAGTPFQFAIHTRVGEYLEQRLKALEIKKNTHSQTQIALWREKVWKEAQEFGFFTLASLKAQRAGIRDFAEGWSLTFPYVDSVQAQYSQNLSYYDLKSLAFKRLDREKQDIIDRIADKDAQKFAQMYLLAERIGEGPFEWAMQKLENQRQNLSSNPEYVAFLDDFSKEIARVQPGQPAYDFQFTDVNGAKYSLKDFEGKFLLLDFWAQWCGPCLEEFPDMNHLYSSYSRDQFEILAINIDEDKSVWQYAIEKEKNPWIQVFGGLGFENELFKQYRGGGIPFYVLIGPDGNIFRYNDIRPSFNLDDVLCEELSPKTASVK